MLHKLCWWPGTTRCSWKTAGSTSLRATQAQQKQQPPPRHESSLCFWRYWGHCYMEACHIPAATHQSLGSLVCAAWQWLQLLWRHAPNYKLGDARAICMLTSWVQQDPYANSAPNTRRQAESMSRVLYILTGLHSLLCTSLRCSGNARGARITSESHFC